MKSKTEEKKIMDKIDIILLDYKYMPQKKHTDDAGFDVKARRIVEVNNKIETDMYVTNNEVTLWPDKLIKIYLGFKLDIPSHLWCLLAPRSGHFFNWAMHYGVIDPGFQGEACALVQVKNEPFVVTIGDRIGQLVFIPKPKIMLNVVPRFKESERGESGFGSTGVK